MRADSIETIEDLLDSAERLFARHGVEHVALTRIVAASRQKNRSAVHYHFGSREGVLVAVLDRRLKHMNGLRRDMLAARTRFALSDAVHILVAPLAFVVSAETWGPDYISVQAQVSFHPRLLGERMVDNANLSALRRSRQLVEEALPGIPKGTISNRLRWFNDSVVLAVARWARETPKGAHARSQANRLVEQLVVYGVAALSAPPSPRRAT